MISTDERKDHDDGVSQLLEEQTSSNDGNFMYILECSENLKAQTGSAFAAFDSLFGFRKRGHC